MVFNAAYVARGFELYRRTGFQHREFVQLTLLCICLPFCAAFLLGPVIGRLVCPRAADRQKRQPRPVHNATRIHVDSLCAVCSEFFAVAVLQPCGLGLCPDCFRYFYPKQRLRSQGERRHEKMAPIVCPQCKDRATHWVCIKHCDLEDEKAV